jgi:hypothetical protein
MLTSCPITLASCTLLRGSLPTMTNQIPYANARATHAMNPEQLNQIVEAILAGKYSWACVLLLRCAGYNPLHYIPYRTYNRLIKENCQIGKPSQTQTDKINNKNMSPINRHQDASSLKGLNKIKDLDYLETSEQTKTQGGSGHLDEWSVCSQEEQKFFSREFIQLPSRFFSLFK